MDDGNQEQYLEVVDKDGDMYNFVLPVRAYFPKTRDMTVTCLELPYLKDLSASEITRRVKLLYRGEYGDWFPVTYVIRRNTIILPFAYKEIRLDYLHWMNENLFACEGKVHITLHPKDSKIASSNRLDNTVERAGNVKKSGVYRYMDLSDEERKNEMDPFVSAQNKKRNRNVPAGPAKILGVVVGAGLALSLISGCFSVIETGERGVVLRFGEYRYTMNEGLNFKAPFIDSVYKLQVRDRSYNSDVEVSSKDMQTIKISSSLVYSLDTQKVGDIYRRHGNNIESTIIKPTVAEIINSTIAQYPIEEFVSKRDEISQKIMGTLKTRMSDIGIDIKSFLITNHDFSDDYNKAIEQKKIAEQAAITAEYNKQKAHLDSEANKYRQEGLSKYVLMEKFLDKWDGHMPKVFASDDSNMSMILDAQDLK